VDESKMAGAFRNGNSEIVGLPTRTGEDPFFAGQLCLAQSNSTSKNMYSICRIKQPTFGFTNLNDVWSSKKGKPIKAAQIFCAGGRVTAKSQWPLGKNKNLQIIATRDIEVTDGTYSSNVVLVDSSDVECETVDRNTLYFLTQSASLKDAIKNANKCLPGRKCF
jgi:hypothetical protein